MAAFLLWNIDKQQRDSLVQCLVREHDIDVVLLVEYYPSRTGSLLSTLLPGDGLIKRNSTERFGVFARRTHGMTLAERKVGGRMELWDWVPDSGTAGRFALVHGLDRRHNDDGTRRVFFHRVAGAIKRHETNSHRRSMIVGDFNAQPFESAVMSSDGLHAIGVRQVDNQVNRLVRLAEAREDFFYNPMWRFYGQQPALEAGTATHYWQNGLAGELFWHMLDQVVIRPEECVRFPEDRIRILTKVGTVDLLTPGGIPDRAVGSDHLPVIFHWNL